MGVVQVFIGAAERTPPRAQSSPGLSHAEISVQDHTVDAIVTAFEKISVKGAQLVGHPSRLIAHPPGLQFRLLTSSAADFCGPAGPLVATFRRNIRFFRRAQRNVL